MKTGKKILSMLVMAMLCAMVFMTVNVSAYSINKNETTITKGFSEKLSVPGAKKVKWSTSNKKVATVSKTGKVTAKKAGRTVITATVGKEKYTCNVTVRDNYFICNDDFYCNGVSLRVTELKYKGSGLYVKGYLCNATPFTASFKTISLKIYDQTNRKNKLLASENIKINRSIAPRSYAPISFTIPKKYVKAKNYDLAGIRDLYSYCKY